MKNKKNILIVFILIVLVILSIFLYFNRKNIKNYKVKEEFKTEIPKEIEDIKNLDKAEIKSQPVIPDKIENQGLNVSLLVLDKKYDIAIKKGDSVFIAMGKARDNRILFDFNYTATPGMGSFITGINGQMGSPGKYWIYYVNDIKASVGVSQYILKEGDIIKWKQEGL